MNDKLKCIKTPSLCPEKVNREIFTLHDFGTSDGPSSENSALAQVINQLEKFTVKELLLKLAAVSGVLLEETKHVGLEESNVEFEKEKAAETRLSKLTDQLKY